eukprot:6183237-Pleurochrysis_carterae.AAC.7
MQVPSEVLAHFMSSSQYIGQLDLLGAVAACCTFARELKGTRFIHWINNTSKLAALVKGYLSRPDLALIVHAFHAFNVGLGARVWFEYVASKANTAEPAIARGAGAAQRNGQCRTRLRVAAAHNRRSARGERRRRVDGVSDSSADDDGVPTQTATGRS